MTDPAGPMSADRATFGTVLEQLRGEIETALDRYLPDPDSGSDCPPRLAEAIRYSALGPGKRLRPILCLLGAEACGGSRQEAMPTACALEMIHCYSLIHDDLPCMDDDDLRRGLPTCHVAFDEATAMLAGDALLTQAFGLVAGQIDRPEVATRCVAYLAEAAGSSGMVGGQMADLEAEGRAVGDDPGSLAELEAIHRRKTGALLRAALRLGGLTAEANSTQLDSLDQFGSALGLAFQIVDDLLDVEGDPTKTGKATGKDSALGKWTYPAYLGREGSRRRARQLTDQALEALDGMGPPADRLRILARQMLERDR